MSDWIAILLRSEAGVVSGLFFIGPFVAMCIEKRRNMRKNYDTDDTEKNSCNASYEGGVLEMEMRDGRSMNSGGSRCEV